MRITRLGLGGGVTPTLNAFDGGDTRATVIVFYGNRVNDIRFQDEVVNTLQARMGTGGNQMPMLMQPVAFSQNQREEVKVVAPTLSASNNPSRSPQSSEITAQVDAMVRETGVVRRLTPMECERLQGFPDDWTAERIDEKKGLVKQADSSRYKQMGNAVAVPCVEWIINRLVEHEAKHRQTMKNDNE